MSKRILEPEKICQVGIIVRNIESEKVLGVFLELLENLKISNDYWKTR